MDQGCPLIFKCILDRVDKNTTWTCNHLDVVQLHQTKIIVVDIQININYKNQINFVSLFDGQIYLYAKFKNKQNSHNMSD